MSETPRSIKASIYIDGKPAYNSLKEVRQNTIKLRRELDGLTYGTNDWNKAMNSLKAHEHTLKKVREEVKGVGGAFGFLKSEIGKLGVLAAGYLGFQFVTDAFNSIISSNAKLSDSLADVRKTTGMSEEAVRRLHKELGKIDTRTSRAELLALSEVAGKLGVAGERDVLGFVRAADKINVALGKDLGDTETAINNLGKLTELFNIKEAYGLEDALIRTGSAINALGASGSAAEPYIVEFTKRMGGVAPQANFSIEAIMGLAATMDELGQPAESSTTALNQFIVAMGKDVPGMARIAGLSVKEFSQLLRTDGNQAMIEVLKNLQSTGRGVEGLAEKMGMVGEDGARAIAAIGALSNNLDLLAQRQKLSNEEFAKATSLQDEFNVKNETFGAVLDRTSKAFRSLTSNTILVDFLKSLVLNFSKLLDWSQKNMELIVTLIKLLLIAGSAWAMYNVGLKLTIKNSALLEIKTQSLAAKKALLAGNVKKAREALNALFVTLKANPLGAFLALLTAAVAMVILFKHKTTEAANIQKEFNNIEAEAQKASIVEMERLKALQKVLSDENESREKKILALKRINELNPAILQGLTQEEALHNKGVVAINKYIQALNKKVLAEAAVNAKRRLIEENIDIDSGKVDDITTWQAFKAFAKSGTADKFSKTKEQYGRENAAARKEKNLRTLKAIDEKYGSVMFDQGNSFGINDVTTGGASTGGLSTKEKKKSSGRSDQLFKEAEKERIASLERTEQIIMDAHSRELSELNEHYRKLKDKHKTNSAAVLQLEKERKAKIAEFGRNFDKEQAQKLRAVKKEISEIAAAAIDQDTDRELAELELSTNEKLYRLDEENRLIVESLNKKEVRIRNLVASGKTEEADILSKSMQLELDQIQTNEDLKTLIVSENAKKRKKILKEAADADSLSELEASVINANSGNNTKDQYDAAVALLDFKYNLEVQKAQEAGKSVAEIEARYRAERKRLDQDLANQNKEKITQAAQLASDTVFSIMAASRKRDSEQHLNSLEQSRNAELDNKNLTEAQKTAINEKYDKLVRAEKIRAFRAEQRAAVAQALINGAIAVTKALPNPFQVSMTVGATAAQVATILAQPVPEYAVGGFSDKDPEGFVSRPTVFSKSASGRSFIAGEAGREWIAPNWMLRDERYANMISMLEVARQGKRAFASGGSTGSTLPAPTYGDNSNVERLLEKMIDSVEKSKAQKVTLVYSDLERFTGEIAQIRKNNTL